MPASTETLTQYSSYLLIFRQLGTIIVSTILALALSLPVSAAIEATEFEDVETTQRYQAIIAELRCLVCQNQNLADSDAGLAKDLRRKAAEMIRSGASDDEILEYMQERYGDFVLYRPPFNSTTLVLWIGPFLLLFFAVCFLLFKIKQRQNQVVSAPISEQDEARRLKIREMIDNAPNLLEGKENPNDKGSD